MLRLRFLLLQVRNDDDPMREHEVASFFRALNGNARGIDCRIDVGDLLAAIPRPSDLAKYDCLLLGGSGDYSAAAESAWLDRVLDAFREIHDGGKPTFASCWGFQAFARALGGRCIHDPAHAELGTISAFLTEAGRTDPVFGHLPVHFRVQAGHQDAVTALPSDAVLLASSQTVANQAFTFERLPIYCTQFHPELDCDGLLARLRSYPEYVRKIAGVSFEEFAERCDETPESNTLVSRFVEHVFG
jgi:GMP synthase (glutamine-hydrolysing)